MTKADLIASLDDKIVALEREIAMAKVYRQEVTDLSDGLVALLAGANGRPTKEPKAEQDGRKQMTIADAAEALFKLEPKPKTAAEIGSRIGRKNSSTYQVLRADSDRFTCGTTDKGDTVFSLKK